jgi:hypothetical protein
VTIIATAFAIAGLWGSRFEAAAATVRLAATAALVAVGVFWFAERLSMGS